MVFFDVTIMIFGFEALAWSTVVSTSAALIDDPFCSGLADKGAAA